MADHLMPIPGAAHVQAAPLPGGRLAWAEISPDGRRVDWIVYTKAGEPQAYGSDRVPGRRLDGDREAALEAAVLRLQARYPVQPAAASIT